MNQVTTCEKCQTLRWCGDHGSDGVVAARDEKIARLNTLIDDLRELIADPPYYHGRGDWDDGHDTGISHMVREVSRILDQTGAGQTANLDR